MKLSLLHGLKTFMLQMTRHVLTVILTIIYTFQLSVNISVEASVPLQASETEDIVTMLTRRVYLEPTNSTPALSPVSTNPRIKSEINSESLEEPLAEPPKSFKMPTANVSGTSYPGGIKAYYQAKIEAAELTINERTQNLRRLEAQRNALNARGKFGGRMSYGRRYLTMLSNCIILVRLLREELQLLMEPGSYVGEVVKAMGKTKVLVKVQPEGKYSELYLFDTALGSCYAFAL